MQPTISIQTAPATHEEPRESINNRSMVAPAPRTQSGLTLRPMSLGSLEILRQLGNPLAAPATKEDDVSTRTIAEFVWVHAAPIETVLDMAYNTPDRVPRAVAEFTMNVPMAQFQEIIGALTKDRAAVDAAGAAPMADDDLPESKN